MLEDKRTAADIYLDALAQEFLKYCEAEREKSIEKFAKEYSYKSAWEELRKVVEEHS